MQFQLKHLLIATTIIAVTLAISPVLTMFLGLLLAMFLVIDLIVPKRHRSKPADDNDGANQPLSPATGLLACAVLFVISIGLPMVQALIYLSNGWYLQLWLIPQLLTYIASLVLLSFVRFDSHDRYEYRVIVTILYVVFAPVSFVAAFLLGVFAN